MPLSHIAERRAEKKDEKIAGFCKQAAGVVKLFRSALLPFSLLTALYTSVVVSGGDAPQPGSGGIMADRSLSWILLLGHFESPAAGGKTATGSKKFILRCMGSLLSPNLLVTSHICRHKLQNQTSDKTPNKNSNKNSNKSEPVYAVSLPDAAAARSGDSLYQERLALDLEQSSSSHGYLIATLPLAQPLLLRQYPRISLAHQGEGNYQFASVINQSDNTGKVRFSLRTFPVRPGESQCQGSETASLVIRNGAPVSCLALTDHALFYSDLGGPLWSHSESGGYAVAGLSYSLAMSLKERKPLPFVTFTPHLGYLCQQLMRFPMAQDVDLTPEQAINLSACGWFYGE